GPCVASNQKSDGSAIKKQQANKKKQQAEAVDNNTEEDFDALLAEFAAMDSVCGYPDCKTPSHGCAHCRRRYCFSHFVPEVHGCGQAAREAARRVASGSATSGPVAPPKSNREAVRRAQLHRRLEARLDDMEQSRRPARRCAPELTMVSVFQSEETGPTFEQLGLPQAVLNRLIKSSLPDSASVAKDARKLIGDCAIAFALRLTAAANDVMLAEAARQHRSTRGRVFRKQPLNSKKAAAPQGRKTMTAADVELALVEAEFEAFLPADPLADFETLNTNNNNVSNDANSGPTATLDDLDDIMNAVVSGTDDKEGDASQASPGRVGDDTCSTTVQQPRRSYVDALVQFHAPSSSCDEDKAGSKDADDTPVAAEVSDNSKPWSVPNNVVSLLVRTQPTCSSLHTANGNGAGNGSAGTGNQPEVTVCLRDEALASILSAKAVMTQRAFEIKVDDVVFLGYSESPGCWSCVSNKGDSSCPASIPDAGSTASSTGSGGSGSPQQRRKSAAGSSSISTFCIIFAVRCCAPKSINKLYIQLARQLTTALRHEEQRCKFLHAQQELINQLMAELEDARQQR
uniref:CBFD_NFYB_HMF domain-containing protein n=1 Tax=Macrostomum lignano TaxID=282301 RepID=A0A1I8JPN6_9PLAT